MYKHTPFTRLKNALVYRAQHKFLIAVLGIFTNDAGEVLLLKHVYLKQLEAALQREVKEETGLEVEITSLARARFGTRRRTAWILFLQAALFPVLSDQSPKSPTFVIAV